MLVSALRSKICEFREANGGGEGRVGIYRRGEDPTGRGRAPGSCLRI